MIVIFILKNVQLNYDDYLKTGDINKCPRFSVKIEDLVK